jgi:hypothetical protein
MNHFIGTLSFKENESEGLTTDTRAFPKTSPARG